MTFSVIVPTYGRTKELEELLQSIVLSDFDKSEIEVLVIDQNDKIDISPIINNFHSALKIEHIKSEEKGIAKAKNIGINRSSGSIITFADDDMKYYPDTFDKVIKAFGRHRNTVVYGRVFDREKNKKVIRNWLDKAARITVFNLRKTHIAIACFSKVKDIRINEQFGVGSPKYGVGEEYDYLFKLMEQKHLLVFNPTIEVYHPEVTITFMTKEKTYYYALGMGAVMRAHLSFPLFIYFCTSLLFQLVSLIKYCLLFDFTHAYKRFLAIKGRLQGFVDYKEKG